MHRNRDARIEQGGKITREKEKWIRNRKGGNGRDKEKRERSTMIER